MSWGVMLGITWRRITRHPLVPDSLAASMKVCSRRARVALREQTFMLAARLSGTRGWRVILRHVIPNITPQLMTFSLLGIGVVIILEGALSFLGLGIPLPEASWGSMIAQGQQTLSASPYLVLIPSAFLFATVVSLNLVGDALRERWGVR